MSLSKQSFVWSKNTLDIIEFALNSLVNGKTYLNDTFRVSPLFKSVCVCVCVCVCVINQPPLRVLELQTLNLNVQALYQLS